MRYIVLHTDVRLPDLHEVPEGFEQYGRAAVLRSGNYWHGNEKSSHPACDFGLYYAVKGNHLYLSPRGVAYDFTSHLSNSLLKFVAQKVGLKAQYYISNEDYEQAYNTINSGSGTIAAEAIPC